MLWPTGLPRSWSDTPLQRQPPQRSPPGAPEPAQLGEVPRGKVGQKRGQELGSGWAAKGGSSPMNSRCQKKRHFQGTQKGLGRVCCKAGRSQKFLDWEQALIKHKETGDNCLCVLHCNPPYSEFLDLRHQVLLFLIQFALRRVKLTGITLKTPCR